MIWPDEKYGGTGDNDFRFEQIIIEETGYARCGDWYNTLHSRLVGPYLTRFGSAEQRERFLPGCVSGDTSTPTWSWWPPKPTRRTTRTT